MFVLFAAVFFIVLSLPVLSDEIVTDYSTVPRHERGIERVTNFDPRIQSFYSWNDVVSLEPPGAATVSVDGYNAHRQPRGSAYISTTRAYNPPTATGSISIKVKELDISQNYDTFFEAWLVDDETGYWLSLGLFNTDHFGNGILNTFLPERQRLYHNLDAYDAVIVTREPYPDVDPRPTDDVVLYGRIEKREFLESLPTVQQKLEGMKTSYKSSRYTNPVARSVKEERLISQKNVYGAPERTSSPVLKASSKQLSMGIVNEKTFSTAIKPRVEYGS